MTSLSTLNEVRLMRSMMTLLLKPQSKYVSIENQGVDGRRQKVKTG